jgi:RHS repeat-associated protein
VDGLETWEIYGRGDGEVVRAGDGHGILVRRPTGTWIYFAPDGSELHFGTVCDSCGGAEPTCLDPRQGGVARLVDAYDVRGNRTHVSYNRPSGLLVGLSDDLGHALEVRSGGASACYDPTARELRYDGSVVATYAYSGDDLERAVDADGNLLRRYFYFPGGLLHAVVNEGGAAIAEFAYDADGNAVGVIDGASDVAVTYEVATSGHLLAHVTERYGQTSGASTRELDQDGHVVSVSGECSCGTPRTISWQDRNPQCFDDGAGAFTYQQHDAAGRVTYSATYPKTDIWNCPPWQGPSSNAQQEWYGYALVKQIAVGVSLPLAVRTSTMRATGFANEYVGETLDYDPTPNSAIDPPGYQCAQAPLPVGAGVCRRIESGFALDFYGARVFERHATFYTYDGRARLVRTYGPIRLENVSPEDVPPIEERTYWADGETSARRGRLHEIKRYPAPAAAPLVTTIDYDTFGPYAITDAAGATTLLIKDGRGRVRYTVRPGQAAETRFYDGTDPRLTLSAGGAVVRTGYDARGRATIVEHLDGDPDVPGSSPQVAWSEHTIYDAAGNPTHVERRDAAGAVAWARDRQYDVKHRVVGEPHPEQPGRAKQWTYDAVGMLAEVSDEAGRKTTFLPDPWRRVQGVVRSGADATGAQVSATVASYFYEPWRRTLNEVRDGKGISTGYAHDDFGRLAWLRTNTFKDADRIRFFYDARGNLVERRSTYRTIRYTYDGLDRLTSTLAQECGGSDTACTRTNTTVPRVAYEYRYDEGANAGRLTSVVDDVRTVRLGYDAAGRLAEERLEEAGLPALVTSYLYDPDGLVSQVTYPSGLVLAVERERATGQVRRLSRVGGAESFASGVERWPGGPLRSFTFGNGEAYSASMTLRYEPRSIRSGPLALDYTMSVAGDVDAVVEGLVTTRYGYDFQDRLVSVSPGPPGEELIHVYTADTSWPYLTYDRIKQSGVMGPSGFAPKYHYDYDQQTNVSSVGVWSGGRPVQAVCLRHDALGRLVLVGPGSIGGGDTLTCLRDSDVVSETARFQYDAQNRRVVRWSAATGEWTYYVHGPGGELLSEVRKTGDIARPWAPVRDYVWLDGRVVAQVEYDDTSSWRTYAVHVDHLGTPRKLSSPEQAVVWSGALAPYGEVTETTAADAVTGRTVVTNLRLPGQYDERLLGSLGLQGPYYNWNRWYLPGIGRYLELDPIALAGGQNGIYSLDWYNYALGNPLTYTDPEGLCVDACVLEAAAAAGIMAVATWYTVCTTSKTCPWHAAPKPRTCPPPPPPRTPCFLIGSGGMSPKPGATQRCTYSCEPPGGVPYQINERYVTCPPIIYR